MFEGISLIQLPQKSISIYPHVPILPKIITVEHIISNSSNYLNKVRIIIGCNVFKRN